jgi:hypothetical protein
LMRAAARAAPATLSAARCCCCSTTPWGCAGGVVRRVWCTPLSRAAAGTAQQELTMWWTKRLTAAFRAQQSPSQQLTAAACHCSCHLNCFC